MQTRYPIRAVAKITGLSLDTLRAWERRYQAVVPERSDRGRQYGPAQIERLLQLSRLVQKGHAIGGIAKLSDEQLNELLDQQPTAPRKTSKTPAEPADLLGTVLAAVEAYDSARAGDELSRLAAVLAPRDLMYQVAVPLMREVGLRWHDGTFAIAQEHLVSQMLRTLLGSMLRLVRPSNTVMKMVLATPAGESHEFGILAAAMLASLHGVEPVYLGPSLPAADIARAAKRTAADVVVLGVTFPSLSTEQEIKATAEAMPAAAQLWIGGTGAAGLDLSNLGRPHLRIEDFPAFERACEQWRVA